MAGGQCNITLYATDKPPKIEVIYDTPISVTVWINSEPLNNIGELAKTHVAADYLRVIQGMRVVSCSIDPKIPPNISTTYVNAARSTFLAYTKEDSSIDIMPRPNNENAKNTVPRAITDDEKFIIISKVRRLKSVPMHEVPLSVDEKQYNLDAADTNDTIINIIAVKIIEHRVTPPSFDCKTEAQWRKLRNFVRSNCGFLVKEKERLRYIAAALSHQLKLKNPAQN